MVFFDGLLGCFVPDFLETPLASALGCGVSSATSASASSISSSASSISSSASAMSFSASAWSLAGRIRVKKWLVVLAGATSAVSSGATEDEAGVALINIWAAKAMDR